MASRRVWSRKKLPRVLIVEDELLIALMIDEMVRQIGYTVSGIAHTSAEARLEFAKRNFDAVLLDYSLDRVPNPELADALLKRGIPFAFLTGYDYIIEPRHEKIPLLQKPFTPAQLRALLAELLGPQAAGAELTERLQALRDFGPYLTATDKMRPSQH